MKPPKIELVPLALAIACGAPNERAAQDRGAPSAPELLLSEAGVGPARLCMPLREAAATLGQAQDTIMESEEVRWAAKIVQLSDGGRVFLESSWTDSTRVWRVSTTSASVRTRAGARVGMTLGKLPQASGPLSARFPEGQLIIMLGGDNAFAQLDTATERVVYADPTIDDDALARIPPTARVRELTVSGRCEQRDTAA